MNPKTARADFWKGAKAATEHKVMIAEIRHQLDELQSMVNRAEALGENHRVDWNDVGTLTEVSNQLAKTIDFANGTSL